MLDYFIVAALMLALFGLHVFLCLRFFAHASGVIKGTKVPRHSIGALLGFIGLALMALAMVASWVVIGFAIYAWLVGGQLELRLFIYMFLFVVLSVAPIVHLIAEMLVNVSYDEA